MPVRSNIHPTLQNLDFSLVDFFDLNLFIFLKCEQTIFEPFKQPIKPEYYIEFVKYFEKSDELLQHMNFEACEFLRHKILEANGFPKEDEYSYH